MSENSSDSTFQDVKNLKNQLNIARNEINNLRQQLKALTQSHKKDCDDIQKKLESWRCSECRNRQMDQDNCGAPSRNQVDLPLQYVGIIHTHFPEKRGTPRQPGICANMIAKILLNNDVFTNPEHALEGLQEFSHMWILFHFHKNDSTHLRAKVSPPRLNGLRTGVFATRSPHRPCPIGLSLVKIDRIMENTIYFSGVDMIDQTPVLDIKPYIPQYDNPSIALLPVENESCNISAIESTASASENATDSRLDNSSLNDLSVNDTSDIDISLDNLNIRVMDGEENNTRNQSTVRGSSNIQLNLNSNLEEVYYTRSTPRIGEREAPDGEEEESPRLSSGATGFGNSTVVTPEGHIRVPAWIDQSPVSTLTVLFKDRALAQLSQLGTEADDKKSIITSVLREDPRSVYLRERLGTHCYVFRIAELNVSCKFNDAAHTVTVFKVFQSSVTDSDE